MMRFGVLLIVLAVLAAILGPQFLFTVDQTQFAIVTRFGEVRRVERTPGLKFKTAFIDQVTMLDNRLLRVDIETRSIPDVENQFLEIDAYVRYRITDPRRFREALTDERTAEGRIGEIVIGALRAEIGQRTRPEIIGALTTISSEGFPTVQEQATLEGIPTREAITRRARDGSNRQVLNSNLGIEIVDVRIKRADFPQATEENVFARMRTERQIQADRLRAEGEEDFRRLTADVDRRVEVLRAEADERSNRLRGEGEAEAIRILSSALERDPDLFAFRRSLEAYRRILVDNTTAVLPANSELLQFLQSPQGLTAPRP